MEDPIPVAVSEHLSLSYLPSCQQQQELSAAACTARARLGAAPGPLVATKERGVELAAVQSLPQGHLHHS